MYFPWAERKELTLAQMWSAAFEPIYSGWLYLKLLKSIEAFRGWDHLGDCSVH